MSAKIIVNISFSKLDDSVQKLCPISKSFNSRQFFAFYFYFSFFKGEPDY